MHFDSIFIKSFSFYNWLLHSNKTEMINIIQKCILHSETETLFSTHQNRLSVCVCVWIPWRYRIYFKVVTALPKPTKTTTRAAWQYASNQHCLHTRLTLSAMTFQFNNILVCMHVLVCVLCTWLWCATYGDGTYVYIAIEASRESAMTTTTTTATWRYNTVKLCHVHMWGARGLASPFAPTTICIHICSINVYL